MVSAQKTVTIVDGYNAIHRVPAFRKALDASVEAGRRALISYCIEWMSRRRDTGQFLIVFDSGPSVGGSCEGVASGVRVVNTRHGESADERIHDMLQEWQPAARCTVVSDDTEVARRARQVGADVMSAAAFAGVLRQPDGATDDSGGKNALTPGQEKTITDELRRLWGAD